MSLFRPLFLLPPSFSRHERAAELELSLVAAQWSCLLSSPFFLVGLLFSFFSFTGRRHQLRVHCNHAGHCIIGDATYGGPRDQFPFRMFLHAASLCFPSSSCAPSSLSSPANSLNGAGEGDRETLGGHLADAKDGMCPECYEEEENTQGRQHSFPQDASGSLFCPHSVALPQASEMKKKIRRNGSNERPKRRRQGRPSYLSKVPPKVAAPHDFHLFIDPEPPSSL